MNYGRALIKNGWNAGVPALGSSGIAHVNWWCIAVWPTYLDPILFYFKSFNGQCESVNGDTLTAQ